MSFSVHSGKGELPVARMTNVQRTEGLAQPLAGQEAAPDGLRRKRHSEWLSRARREACEPVCAAAAPGVSASPFLCLRNLMLPFASLNPDPC